MLATSRIAAGAMEARLKCIFDDDTYKPVEFMEAADGALG